MKQWKAYIQVNGEECSIFESYNFDISDELYDKIQDAVKNKRSIDNEPFYDELYDLAEAAFDLAGHLGIDPEEDKPDPEDYDDEESYQEDLEMWEEEYGDFDIWENYSLEDLTIYDPGDFDDFKERYIGKKYSDEAGKYDIEYDYNEEIIARYSFSITTDENGIITDISEIKAGAMESESVTSSSWDDCYPDYCFISEELDKEIKE